MPPPLPVAPDTSPSRPVRARWRHARACRPRPSPSLGPRQPVRGTRGRHPRPPHPSPFARKGGARGHAAPTRGHATPPRGHDAPGRPVRTGTPHPGPPFPIRADGTGARECTPSPPPPSLLSAPPRSRGKGACEGKPPHPVTPRSRGNGRTRPSRVEQQDRCGLRAPAFTAPAPRLRGIVRL
ncbi:hypothetical protein EDB85DRAFT_2025358, partial [Lactarius pseudohatsudake]